MEEYKPFKMKGNPFQRNYPLPGVNHNSEGNTDLPNGRSASSPFQASGCAPGDPDCDKRFRVGKRRGKRIKKWVSTAGKNIGKTARKVAEKVKDIQLPTIIKKKDEATTSYKNPRWL